MHYGFCQGQKGCKLLQIFSTCQMSKYCEASALQGCVYDPINISAWEPHQDDVPSCIISGRERDFCKKTKRIYTDKMLTIIEQENYNLTTHHLLREMPSYSTPSHTLYLTFWVEKYQVRESMQRFCCVILPGKSTSKQKCLKLWGSRWIPF